MASLTTTTSSPAALPAASTTAPSSSVSPAATKRPHLAGDDAPWRVVATGAAGIRPVPRIHHAPVLRVSQDDSSAHALAVMKRTDPIGEGLAMEAVAEAAGPECIVPGQQAPLRLLGLKVWPLDLELKFLEPFGRELHSMKKCLAKFQVPKDTKLEESMERNHIIAYLESHHLMERDMASGTPQRLVSSSLSIMYGPWAQFPAG